MKFILLNVTSATTAVFKTDHPDGRMPSAGNIAPGTQSLLLKDDKGKEIGKVLIPAGFTLSKS